MEETMTANEANAVPTPAVANKKQPYHRPALSCFGDMRTMTLSPTPFPEEESGRVGTYRSTIPFENSDFQAQSSRREDSGGGRSSR